MNTTAPEKKYRLTFEERPGYLYALVEGEEDSYEISRAFWHEVAAKARSLQARRILIEEQIEMAVSFADVFKLASEIPDMGFGPARIAFVDRYLEQNEINEFGELVAVNRGANGRIFREVDTAVEWLLA